MGRKGSADCEPEVLLIRQLPEIPLFSELARLLLSSAYRFCQWSEQMEAQVNQVALPLRSHTILGVCEAIGEDFGFNPVLLWIPFAASVIYSPTMAIAAYFALGLVVLASRLLFPKAKAKPESLVAHDEPVAANEQRELAKAA
jgi:phage shock protein PspC (stress-responsive transcriptional regulator)